MTEREKRQIIKNTKMLFIKPTLTRFSEEMESIVTIYQLERALTRNINELLDVRNKLRTLFPNEVEKL